MPSKPPLALSAVAIDAGGAETIWWSGDRLACNRPQSLSFRTRIGEGFSDASLWLPRRVDQDYADLDLYNTVVLVGDDGQIAYEGRIGATPRSTGGGHQIAVQLAGWMAHARDRKFTKVFVDRDLSGWQAPGVTRQAALSTATIGFKAAEGPFPDTTGGPSIKTGHTGKWDRRPYIEALYDAGAGNLIGSIYYAWQKSTDLSAASNWEWEVFTTASDNVPALTNRTGNLEAAGPGSGTLTAATPQRYGGIYLDFSTAGAAGVDAANYSIYWQNLAVYGDHGLTKRGTAPQGFYASDMLRYVAQNYCPKLSTAGVQDTTLVIPHAAFKDRTAPYDAFLLFNGPHNYELAVWEDKTLHFRPYDLSDYDWQVRMDQPGADLSLQGDTTEGLANYAIVEFDDVTTGRRNAVGPTDSSDLEDTTVDHPANTHGLDVELTVGLTFPATPDQAVAFGRSYLQEFNRPKNRGQITVQGHILDAAGHWCQAWRPRYGETISVVDHPNDSPRLITETSYDHPTRTVTISTDNGELQMLDAVVDYIQTNLKARNLT